MFRARSLFRFVSTVLIIVLAAGRAAAFGPTWVEQGPGPINFGQSEGITNNPVSGGVCSIAVDQTDSTGNTVYVGTVNGGVWKTTNFLTANPAGPTYTPLTDFQLPGLSINALAISPVDHNTIFAGTGSTSSFAFDGNPGVGVARSTDGGATWTVLATPTFFGRVINSVVPTTLNGGNVVLASTLFDGGGVYRSMDAGVTFTRISASGTGLPNEGVSSLVADPGDPNRFYVAVARGFGGSTGAEGVYRSTDGGLSWTPVNMGLTGLSSAMRILLSVHNSPGINVDYAAVINTSGALSGVFRSVSQGGAWTPMGVPSPPIFPGFQGELHGALVVDPSNPNVVYISGDRQNSPFPNVNGAQAFSMNAFRGDASLLPATPWQNIVDSGANRTSPHADSRVMVFDPVGNLLQGNDGGIYRLSSPNSAARTWFAMQGNIRPTEIHSVAFDPLSKVLISGNQDTGTAIQDSTGSMTWHDIIQGDGGVVAIDADQTAHPGTSIRYVGFTGLPQLRLTYNASNALLTFSTIPFNITSGTGTGLTINQFDSNIQFYNPFVLNRVNPARMLIGTASIYESMDKGATVANLGFTGAFIGDGFGNSPIDYGGMNANGTPNPGSFYAGAGTQIFHRHADGSSIVALAGYPGEVVRALVSDPKNVAHLFVLDVSNHVWGSFNEGTSWTNLTVNLGSLTGSGRTIEIFSPSSSPLNTVLLVGGDGGVFQMRRPGAAGSGWAAVSSGLPHALVFDLHYDYVNNVLAAGTLGRGAWTLTSFFRGGGGTGLNATAATVPPTRAAPSSGITGALLGGIEQEPPGHKPARRPLGQ